MWSERRLPPCGSARRWRPRWRYSPPPTESARPPAPRSPGRPGVSVYGPTTFMASPPMRLAKYSVPLVVGNDHHREERHQRGEEQAVQEDHQPGLLQVLQLGMFDFAVDLCQRLFAAHGQHGMAKPDQQHDQRDLLPPRCPAAIPAIRDRGAYRRATAAEATARRFSRW